MSYKTIKRLLGETSLERKCRFLFGSGLLLLITGSFYFYAWQTTQLIHEQNLVAARLLVAPIIMEKHWKWSENRSEHSIAEEVARMAVDLKPLDMKKYNWTLSKADLNDPASRPPDDAGHRALERISKPDGDREVFERLRKLDPETNHKYEEFNYYAGVFATDTCVACHRQHNDKPELKTGDLVGMVKITFPLDKTQRALAWNNAILLATAIVTAFLAMLAAYAIVRYVIVKPVLHLKDVSDAIARGSLDQRADIRTGDEFEELSHAFNRMLRHLVTVQEELQQLNRGYEVKVDELAQANLRLYELNNLKNEFLATMSHELRTPLNSILGFSDVLVNAQGLTEKQRRYVSNIQSSGKTLMNLINDVLDLAKIEAGKMELHIVEFSIADLIERLVAQMGPLAEKKTIDLGWEVAADVPLAMQDSGKLEQILSNLLSNAIKFTPEGGRVRVRAERRDKVDVALIVEDTGIGIPLEEQEKIFEKFRQGKGNPGQSDTLTREYEGTGLGLSIIRELSKLLGGDVHLESEFGRGSVFTVLIPARLDPEHPPKVIDDFHPRPLSRPEPPVRGLTAVQPSLAALEP
jgi:two-component system, NarL family, sensor histidine kinase BarA